MASCAIWKRTRGLALGSSSGPSHSRSHGAASQGGDAVSRPRAAAAVCTPARWRRRVAWGWGQWGIVAWSLERRTVGAVAASISSDAMNSSLFCFCSAAACVRKLNDL